MSVFHKQTGPNTGRMRSLTTCLQSAVLYLHCRNLYFPTVSVGPQGAQLDGRGRVSIFCLLEAVLRIKSAFADRDPAMDRMGETTEGSKFKDVIEYSIWNCTPIIRIVKHIQ